MAEEMSKIDVVPWQWIAFPELESLSADIFITDFG
jgi:hypothetical protein